MRDQRLWTWHIGAGAVILVLLGLHMTVMHLDAFVRVANATTEPPIAWSNVFARARSAFFLVSYVLLLGAALFHGLYGLRNIVFELHPGDGLKKAFSRLLVVGGLVLFLFGTWAAWESYQFARFNG